jgi:VIT1/CCC1 family predicted Fe2+/Mn2+ transporter
MNNQSLAQSKRAQTLLRASYAIFAGFVLMIPLLVVAHGLSGGASSIIALPILVLFAVAWQTATIRTNPRAWQAWVMGFAYLCFLLVVGVGFVLGVDRLPSP